MKTNKRQSRSIWTTYGLITGALLTSAPVDAAEYSYSGDTGPGFWHEIPGASACGRNTEPGARQTPINIHNVTVDTRLRPLDLSLLPAEISIENNGHTVEQEYHNGSILQLNGATYQLLQFHVHTLSEHAVQGERGVMELHAVFSHAGSNSLAVVGQIYQIGAANRFLADWMRHGLPQKAGDVVHPHTPPTTINLADGLTSTSAYYTYPGSLTTPPCTENVTWLVLKKQATMSQAQFETINKVTGNNFRPLKSRNDRSVRATR